MSEGKKRNPLWDETLDVEARLDALIRELTLEEKVTLCGTGAPEIKRLGIPAYATGGEAAHGIEARHDQSFNLGEPVKTTCFPQPFGMSMMWDTALMEEIGEIVGTEARIHAKLENQKGKQTGGLCRWAPTVDMERDPRWGRTEEGYGEDPYLTGKTASAYIRGMRGTDERYIRCGATLKHFYANNMETDRVSASSSIGLRDKYEYYLEPFRRCIEEGGAEAVMTAYNEINGIPAICDPDVQRLLKDTYHLPGHVVCDGGDMSQTVQFHHFFDSHAETVAAALKAGVDNFTDSAELVVPAIKEALSLGLITERDLDRSIRNSFRTRLRLGLFDPEESNPYANPDISKLASKEHAEVAARAAQESVVLLKNEDDFLPYHAKEHDKIAVLGPLANEWYQDWYCGNPPYEITVLQGMKNRNPNQEIIFSDGLDRVMLRIGEQYISANPGDGELFLTDRAHAGVFIRNDWGDGGVTLKEVKSGRFLTAVDEKERICLGGTQAFGWFIKEAFFVNPCTVTSWCGQPLFLKEGKLCAKMRPEDMAVTGGQQDTLEGTVRSREEVTPVRIVFETVRDGIAQAAGAAKEADRVILCLGSNPVIGAKEEIDRRHLHLPAMQERMLAEIGKANPNLVLVIVSNYPYILPGAASLAKAVLFSPSGCQEMGNAVAKVINGEVNPAGRLSMTWISDEGELPLIGLYDLIEGRRTYRYQEGKVQYPFGYGLSYSAFRYEELTLVPDTDAQKLRFRIKVTNTSLRDGEEVVQLYYRKENPEVKRPKKQLVGFERVYVEAGKTAEVTVEVPYRELMYYDVIEERLLLEDGVYLFMAGGSSEALPIQCPVTVKGQKRGYRSVSEWYPADHYDEQQGTYLYQGYEKEISVFARSGGQEGTLIYRNCRYEGAYAEHYEIRLHRITRDVRTGQRQYAKVQEERLPLTDQAVLSAIRQKQEFTFVLSVGGAEGVRDFRIAPCRR